MTNAQAGRFAALGLAAVSCAALAACSSGPSAAQQARATQASAMAAAKVVHQELASVPIAYNADISGRLFSCGTYQEHPAGNGPHSVQYSASEDWTLVKRGSVPLAVLGRRIVQKLNAEGWQLKSAPTPNPEHPDAATYTGQRDGLNMQITEIGGSTLGALVTVFINAKCFDAGAKSSSLTFTEAYDQDIDEPSPAATSGTR